MRIKDKRCFYVSASNVKMNIYVVDPVKQTYERLIPKSPRQFFAVPVGKLVAEPTGFSTSVRVNGITQTASVTVPITLNPVMTQNFPAYSGLKAGDVVEFVDE